MRRSSYRFLTITALAVILAGGLTHAEEPKKAGPEDIGFTWGNDVPELVRRGNEGFQGEDFKAAEDYYRGAQLKDPGEAIAAFNIGLAEAKQGNHESAATEFNRALNLAGPDTGFRAKTQYNLGLSHLQQAMDALSPKDKKNPQAAPSKKSREQAIGQALKAIDAFDATLKLDPVNQDAAINKAKTQHLLQFAATPPPQQSQQNQEGGEGSDGESQDQQGDQQQSSDQQQQDQDQSSQQDEQQQDKGEQEQQQAGQGQDQQQDQQAGQGQEEEQEEQDTREGKAQQADQKEAEMSEEQARELLNILGDQQNVVLRKSRYPLTRPEPKKDW